MSPPSRPPRPGNGGGWTSDLGATLAVAAVLGIGAASAAMWAATQLAALIGTGHLIDIDLVASGRALFTLPDHIGNPAHAWPGTIAARLPGPVVYWPSMLATLAMFGWAASRTWGWWQGRAGRSGPLGVRGTGFAQRRDLDRLIIETPTPGRLTLGYAGRHLVAAEARTSLAVVGPTGCGKTAGFAIPALLEWNGPVIATSVKNDLLDPTLERRRSLGKVWIYDPTGRSGHPAHRWTPLSSCNTWAGAMRIAAWLCEAAQPKMDSVTDGDYWYTQARKALAPYLYAAATDHRTMADVVRWIDAQEIVDVERILRRTGGIDTALDEHRQTDAALARREALRPQIEALLIAAVREGVSALPGGRHARSWQQEPVAKWPLAQQEQLTELVEKRLDEKLSEELEEHVLGGLRDDGRLDALIAAQSLWRKEERLRGSVFATIENVLAGYADPGVATASGAAD